MTTPQDHNRRAWDARALKQERFTQPAGNEALSDPLRVVDGCGWLGGDIRGKRVLCLASGGGRQSALYASAGASVTVVDISGQMLALDRQVAADRRLEICVIEASMDDLSVLLAGSFDIVSQPVSTCYVPNIAAVFREVARVLVAGGLYISQHKQPGCLQADVTPGPRGYELIEPYYRSGPLPQVFGSRHREAGTLEYLHRLEEIFGGICRAGFVIEDVIEPSHAKADAAVGQFGHRSQYVAPYLRIKACRTGKIVDSGPSAKVWLP